MRRLLLLPLLAALLPACPHPECALGDYSAAECRVVAENHYARITTSTGVEVRFQHPDAVDASTWQALGVLDERQPGVVHARPATLADFALSVQGDGATDVSVVLHNVAPDTRLFIDDLEQDAPDPPTLSRTLELQPGDAPVWIRGERDCPDRYRLLAAGDVQTNPIQFERIVEDLHAEIERGEQADEPVLGLLLLGDLTEEGEVDQFDRIEQILARSPLPVATVPGNHDVAGDDYALFNRRLGPGNYAFGVCRTRVVMLDTGDAGLAASVEARLPELLDPTGFDHVLAATHYPVYPDRTGTGFRDGQQAARLLAELGRTGADRLLVGHIHDWLDFPEVPVGDTTVHQVVTGTAGATQGLGVPHYGVTRIRLGEQVQTCFHEVPPPGYPAGSEGGDPGDMVCADP